MLRSFQLLLAALVPGFVAAQEKPSEPCPMVEDCTTHAAAGPAVPPSEQAINGRLHFKPFSILLPRGWKRIQERPRQALIGEASVPAMVRFAGPGGAYLAIEVDAAHGATADAKWECEVSRDRLRITSEGERCRLPPGVGPEDLEEEGCGEGDGHLEIIASCEHLFFMFGNTEREEGVDLSTFRRILASVRLAPVKATNLR